jgi:hypothetical protein
MKKDDFVVNNPCIVAFAPFLSFLFIAPLRAPATQLAIFPGTSHIFVMMHPEWLLSMIQPFLDA